MTNVMRGAKGRATASVQNGAAGNGPVWKGLGRALLVISLCTALAELIWRHVDLSSIVMIYLAGVVYVALRERMSVAVLAVIASVFLFDFLYVPPRWSLAVLDPIHYFTFGIMLVVGLVISRFAARAREHARSVAEAQSRAESELLRSTLLASISHDFRTPLTTIVGAATSLDAQDDKLDDAMRKTLISTILKEARRLNGWVSDVLELTRLEQGSVQLQREWCPADELVTEALDVQANRQSTHPIHVDVQATDVIWCDAGLVERSIVNLVNNALAYTPPGTAVRITVSVREKEWLLVVADTGSGLPEGVANENFRMFQRGSAESSRGGFGLGLAICAAVSRLHGGKIQAFSGASGTCFMMTFPQPPQAGHAQES